MGVILVLGGFSCGLICLFWLCCSWLLCYGKLFGSFGHPSSPSLFSLRLFLSFLGYLFQYLSRPLLSHLSIYLRFPRLVLLCPFCNHRRCLCYCCLFFFAVKCHSHHYCRGRVAVSHYIQYIPERLSPEVERSNISSVGFLHMIQLLQLLVRSELEGSVDAGELVADGGG